MQFVTHRRRQPPTIIIVALIDILIVLVIFLIVTATFKQQPSLKLALPESKEAKIGATDHGRTVVVEIDKQPPYLRLNGLPVTMDQLQAALAAQAAQRPDSAVAIRADALTPFEQVIKVMDAARAAQLTNFSAFVKASGK